MSKLLRAALVACALAAGTAPALPAARELASAEELVAANGGVYRDAELAGYLRTVGMRLVRAAGQPAAGWSFAVLDTPETNAFALPGGRIFVTRGMLALVGDEAELAAVLGHEIGHALAGDGRVPGSDRARRAAEVAADRTGLTLLVRAGYDPGAQADVLATLLAARAVEMRLQGGEPAPAARDHPALGDRLQAARREAGAEAGSGQRNRGAYLAAIDGMTWGDGPAQGYMRGRSFVHPDLRFAFEPPRGYAVSNLPDVVVASGPGGALLLMDSIADPGGSPADYLVRAWVPDIARGIRAGRLAGPRQGKLNGLPVAQGSLVMASDGSERVAELTVVRLGGRLYRLTGLHRPGDRAGQAALEAAARSFRPLSKAEAARMAPLRLRIHRVAPGENVAGLAASMPVAPAAAARARFDVMNGLAAGGRLRAGALVKIVAE
ncbi:MAG TPA: M48 family metalloprotease [Amaricoccus sp.]|nr:M48 family metalloprotease [Amaricoccus sp.]